jgi:7-cyano-7-deazaguanine synthase
MYDAVCLASGGLDSTLCLHLLREQGLQALPVYVNYGQRSHAREWGALVAACRANKFKEPICFEFASFGSIVKSGLTDPTLRVKEDAFTPSRNLLFLVLAAGVAGSRGISNIVIGLLAEHTTLFPDQSDSFLRAAEVALTESLGMTVQIHCPLRDMTKQQVLEIARRKGVSNFYFCHAGTEIPCGHCIACLEYPKGA